MKNILVVDDNPSIRSLVHEILEPDYRTVEAENGEQALELLSSDPFDLIILDIEMPITNGWETLHVIRDEESGWPNLRVIMLTVRKEPENVLKAWGIGAEYYITKPFSPAILLETIHRALDHTSVS
jgi:two-component system OmpR family response regulator